MSKIGNITQTAPVKLGLLFLAGCSSQLVDTGSSVRRPPTDTVAQQAQSIPSQLKNVPEVQASSVITLPKAESTEHYHEVLAGDTLTSIARQYQSSVEKILKSNGFSRDVRIKPGQLLHIPNK
jgi:LysM repeat protein